MEAVFFLLITYALFHCMLWFSLKVFCSFWVILHKFCFAFMFCRSGLRGLPVFRSPFAWYAFLCDSLVPKSLNFRLGLCGCAVCTTLLLWEVTPCWLSTCMQIKRPGWSYCLRLPASPAAAKLTSRHCARSLVTRQRLVSGLAGFYSVHWRTNMIINGELLKILEEMIRS